MKATFLRVGVAEGTEWDDSIEEENAGIEVDETGSSVEDITGEGDGDNEDEWTTLDDDSS